MSIRGQESIWPTLDSSKSEIRLLRLHDDGGGLRGSLDVRSLNHHPRYDAISHAWGRPESSELFTISSEPSDLMLIIPTSLYHCLQTFQSLLPASTLFWVDAICVAQDDLNERAEQVKLMQQIFSYAVNVRVWLGQNNNDFTSAFNILKRACEQDYPSSRLAKPIISEGSPLFAAIARLARADWWYRLWIVQEVALARTLVLHSSSEYFDFALAQKVLTRHALNDEDRVRIRLPSVSAIPRSTVADDFVNGMKHIVRTAQLRQLLYDHSGRSKSRKAEVLVSLFGSNRLNMVADPRDRVYGMLGICNAFFGDFLLPDYGPSVSTEQIYTEFAWRLIETSGSLAVLNQAGNGPKATSSFPSWVPNWNSAHGFASERYRLSQWPLFAAFGEPTEPPGRVGNLLKVNGCNLGCVYEVSPFYFNAMDREAQVERLNKAQMWVRRYPYMLPLRDIIVGKLFRPEDLTIHGSSDEHELHFSCRWRDSRTCEQRTSTYQWHRGQVMSRFYAAMVATLVFRGLMLDSLSRYDQIVHIKIHQPYDALVMLHALLEDLRNPLDDSESQTQLNTASFFLGMQHCRLFWTLEGKIGVCPISAQRGDVVAILSGAKVPFILRKIHSRSEQSRYAVVGEAYVLDCMHGEGRRTDDGETRPLEDFYLE